MDIERLKELQGLVALNTWMSERAKKELLTIINEAIARQSVKSEDVAEAIDVMTQMLKFMDGTIPADAMSNYRSERKAYDLAIAALQAYQPTTRKDRIVEEVAISKTETTSCKWCEGNVSKYFDVNWYDFNGHERLDKSNYCPACGRKLN
jgi:hypothetical protein